MPRVSLLLVRTALVNMALGATLGALVLAQKGLGAMPWAWALLPGHIHLLLVGALVQLAFGVAVWILPRLDAAGDRGDMRLPWAAYAALNAGVALAALRAPAAAVAGAPLPWMPTLAGALYAAAAAAMVAHAWRRVLPFRTLPRPPRA